ncbi:MAG: hydantoinase B/oxoprolinase family protein [Alphaproteobacteria bacterium]|nr:hydantoinase B/oxoprolinase family protein [Alphaproteobacteria bacterium]
MSMAPGLGPILTKILWTRLVSIVDEAATGLVRTAYSMVVRDFHDYCVAIFDARGNMLVHSTKSTPGFIGIMPPVMRNFLAAHPPETLRDGDVLVTNDPWLATSHLLDISVAAPIFDAGRIVGFAVCVVHHLDIGGRMASIDSRDMYEEGLKIPILKLYEAGRRNDTVFAFLAANVRSADRVQGDLRSQVIATNVCAAGIRRMIGEYGFADLDALGDAIMGLAEHSLRRRIATLPDGIYRHALRLPPVGARQVSIELTLALEVRGDSLIFDYTGSSPEVEAAVNVALPMTVSYSVYPAKVALDPTVPHNHGCLRPITVIAPPGSVLNCQPPAPTWGRSVVSHALPELVFGALVDALPERTIAACGSTPLTLMTFSGRRRAGERFLAVASHVGGFGGGASQDGAPCLPFPNNTAVIPVEVIENETGLVYERKELAPDTGGPGRRRGGVGEDMVLCVPTGDQAPPEPVTASIRGWDRRPDSAFPVVGLRGGLAGRGGGLRINGEPRPHNQIHRLVPGDVVELSMPGGGGFGDPLEREADRVRADVVAGLVSRAAAAEDYGVVLRDPALEIDAEATARLRAAKRAGRGGS